MAMDRVTKAWYVFIKGLQLRQIIPWPTQLSKEELGSWFGKALNWHKFRKQLRPDADEADHENHEPTKRQPKTKTL